MSEQEFKKGDVVEPRTAGPAMTVIAVLSGGLIECTWFDKKDERHTDEFTPEALILQSKKPIGPDGYFGPKRPYISEQES